MVYFNPLQDMDGNLIVPALCYIEKDTVVMQFTGLHDKNGKPIYEGDILQIDDPGDKSRFNVVFHRGAFKKKYTVEGETFLADLDDGMLEEWWVIIGNIYENPELLE